MPPPEEHADSHATPNAGTDAHGQVATHTSESGTYRSTQRYTKGHVVLTHITPSTWPARAFGVLLYFLLIGHDACPCH